MTRLNPAGQRNASVFTLQAPGGHRGKWLTAAYALKTTGVFACLWAS
jgi:hypothetical protein